MADYRAPLRDVTFALTEILDYSKLTEVERFQEATEDLLEAVLDEAGKFAADVYAPLNRIGDTQGATYSDSVVATPDGFKEAYAQFVENGWMSLAQSPDFGGQGLPYTVNIAANEFFTSANMAFSLCSMLTSGALDVLFAHASDELRATFGEKMVSGEWTGTMNLTESHAGSDLSTLKTKATPNGDHYLIKGQKIYITWGEHDCADNIIHIVLAPMVDAPAGNKGLSLFLVPKYLVNEDGSLGDRNDVKAVSIEHKLGIHASPTCVMSFGEKEGAVGYLIGEPGDGLRCMFTLMNHARIEVGLEGLALSERAYQDALDYAQQRVQGRNPHTGESAIIIEHADVQRMLMLVRSLVTAMRPLVYESAMSYDLRKHANTEEERAYHERRFALMTPICKAWSTEVINETTSLTVQVHGGMGFIEETGVAQHYRDARITSIYEGTNGIQANDLIGRKLIADGGKGMFELIAEMKQTTTALTASANNQLASSLSNAIEELESTSQYILDNAKSNADFAGSAAYNYLMLSGYVIGGWYQARAILAAAEKADSDKFYQQHIVAANFYLAQVLPRATSFAQMIKAGNEEVIALSPESFAA